MPAHPTPFITVRGLEKSIGTQQILRGINLGPRNRISMPELREALVGAGYDDVGTYLQSGNVVLTSTASEKQVARTASD